MASPRERRHIPEIKRPFSHDVRMVRNKPIIVDGLFAITLVRREGRTNDKRPVMRIGMPKRVRIAREGTLDHDSSDNINQEEFGNVSLRVSDKIGRREIFLGEHFEYRLLCLLVYPGGINMRVFGTKPMEFIALAQGANATAYLESLSGRA